MFRLLLFYFFFVFPSKSVDVCKEEQHKSFVLYKNAIADRILNKYLSYSRNHVELDSKFGRRVQKKVKIRKDVFFLPQESKLLDKVIVEKILPKVKDIFNLTVTNRQNYKLGKYYASEKGFYNPHTDIQGGWEFRNLSMIICLSDKRSYKGGIFRFVKLKEEFKLSKGDVLLFKSNLLHAVNPVTSGVRQVIISFLWDKNGELLRRKKYLNRNKFNNNFLI